MRTPKYETVVAEMKRRFLLHSDDDFDWEIDSFQSPIEKAFVGSMLANGWHPSRSLGSQETERMLDTLEGAGLHWPAERVMLSPTRFYLLFANNLAACVSQPSLSLKGREIRPDFAFVFPEPYLTKVIVELDGHEFHERTPEQAQSDKSRDRELQTMGWDVMRFTGREVLRGPCNCIEEVCQLLHAKVALDRWSKIRGEEP